MTYKVILTPPEVNKYVEIDISAIHAMMDRYRDKAKVDIARVFAQIPIRIDAEGVLSPMSIERSVRYKDSIAVVKRRRKRLFFIEREQVISLDLSVNEIGDATEELDYFVRSAGTESAMRELTHCFSNNDYPTIFADGNRYRIEAQIFEPRSVRRSMASIHFGFRQIKDLIRILRSFQVEPTSAWNVETENSK